MPYYESRPLSYNTPPEVIFAEWGKDKEFRDLKLVSMNIFIAVEGTLLTDEVIEWAIDMFFKGPFSTSLPNPHTQKVPTSIKRTATDGRVSMFEILYPDPNEFQK